ncbi:uncharacterized protein EV422DRAFT_513899 [Fimicolochytrium jonesii]|uniref:uncharacterized protein n=1 Tax=Fimicolochytrium jonesii TaxID=1396493 RepID=UPI0022FED5DF|nr:uncharacterized protein EV422DRAFT_513899 [Fimicolochytrium jonesii]KAI8825698.1 hypothetical protein EV422DRAFT_513899 [Fimicolochytrium jonesii]
MAAHNVGDSIMEFVGGPKAHKVMLEAEYQSMLTSYLTEMVNRDRELSKRHICVFSEYKVEFVDERLWLQPKIDILVRKARGPNNFVVIETARETGATIGHTQFDNKANQLVCNMLAITLERVVGENNQQYKDLRILGAIVVNFEARLYTLRFSKSYLEGMRTGDPKNLPQSYKPYQQLVEYKTTYDMRERRGRHTLLNVIGEFMKSEEAGDGGELLHT